MKTYRNMFDKILPPDTVAKCALDAAEEKLKRPEVLRAFAYFDETYDGVAECAKDPDYRPCEDNTHEIIDGANGKKRAIEKPRFNPEQILHHMLMEPFKEVLLNGLYEQVYGCIPKLVTVDRNGKKHVRKFGPHAAIRQLGKWIQTGRKTYVAEMDVKSAYGSVHIPTLARLLCECIKDREWVLLMFRFLHYTPKAPECETMRGLILGHFPSPWLFNFYLKKFDHFAATLPGVKYLRYADNLFLVGKSKRKVHRAVAAIKEYLRERLKLELNGSTQVYRFEYGTGETDQKGREKARGRAANALGAIIHYNRVTLRKSILMRMRRKALRIGRKKNVTWHDGASMLSRLSWVRHTDTFGYYERNIKTKISIRKLKCKVRLHSRAIMPIVEERRRIINDGLEKSTRLAGRKAEGVGHDNKRDRRISAPEHRAQNGQGHGRTDRRVLGV